VTRRLPRRLENGKMRAASYVIQRRLRPQTLALLALLALSGLSSPAVSTPAPPIKLAAASGSWTVYHHDDAHTGNDPTLPKVSSVSTSWVSAALDGEVYASPLVYNGIVYAATLNNTVYAFNQTTGAVVWSTNLGAPETTGWQCGNVSRQGILGSPVIDLATGRIYVAAQYSSDNVYKVSGLNLSTGHVDFTTPIPGTIGTGFDWTIQQQRGALAVHNGYVYVPFGGRDGDCGSYHGWVVGVPTSGSTTLAVYETAGIGSGIWGAGGVAVDDATGNVFAATGNGVGSGCGSVNQNDAVVRLSPSLALQDFFMPQDWAANWCGNDQDLGSAGPTLLSSNVLFQTGKWGGGFLLNPNSLGGVDGQQFPTPKPAPYSQADVCFGNHSDATFGSFAYGAPFVYIECEGRGLVALNVNPSSPSFSPCNAACAAPDWSAGGATTFGPPIVAGGAVWAASNGGGLFAFDAATGAQIFHSAPFGIDRFVTPAEAGGQVFVPSLNVIRSFTMNFAFTLDSLGGVLLSGPGASSWGTTRADAFGAGTDSGMWHTWWDGTKWNSWEPLGGILTSDPAAASLTANRIDVFVRGTDAQLWHIWWAGAGWSGWQPLGGILTSGPGVTVESANHIDVVVRGTDSGLWHKWWDASTGWSSWEPLGGLLTSDPRAVSWASGRLDVFARGTDNGLWHRYWDGTTWHNWESLGGLLTSAPAASSCASGSMDVWALGTDGGLWRRTFTAGAWGPWQSYGGQWTSSPAAACRPGTTTIDLYLRGVDDSLWHLGF
jgi:outer membrane protein assembly factor BamB